MIAVVGLSHRSAPIEVRERLAIPPGEVPAVLRQLVEKPAIGEALLLCTCNRVEVAVGPAARDVQLEAVLSAATEQLEARAPGISQHTYSHLGAAAVRHLFRVAASLDSLVLGEPQILGQLKQAFELARAAGTIGARLNRTIPRAIRAAKRVRTETSVGAGQVSVPSVAVDLARQIFGELRERTAVLIGSGEMAETVARLLASERVQMLVVGRDEARVGELTARVGGQPRLLSELDQALLEADVVITSTSAPHYVVERGRVQAVHRARRGRSLFFIDLAVPRDVDPGVGDLDRMFVYNVDDFSHLVAESFSTRRREAELAEQIVAREAEGFDRWLDATEQVTPAVVSLRSRFEQVLGEELERSLRGRLKHLGQEERAALAKMSEAALNKLLHAPTSRLRQVALDQTDGGLHTEQLLSALQELFELSPAPGESAEPSASEDSEADAPADEPSEPHDPGAARDGIGRGGSGLGPQ